MHLVYTDTRKDLIADGIDIAFRFGALPDSSLNTRKIGDKIRTLACSPEYYASHETPNFPRDLKD